MDADTNVSNIDCGTWKTMPGPALRRGQRSLPPPAHVHRLQQAYWLTDVPTLRSVAARLAKLAARGNKIAGGVI